MCQAAVGFQQRAQLVTFVSLVGLIPPFQLGSNSTSGLVEIVLVLLPARESCLHCQHAR